MKSPRFDSSSSPTGESSDSGSCEIPQQLAHALRLELHLRGELVDRRLAFELLVHLPLGPRHPVHVLDHVHRDADRARLVGDRSGDRLADPPRRIRRELEALGVVELVDRSHQAEVALLDQVEQLHPATRVPLGDADHEPEVGLGELALGPLAPAHGPHQHALLARRELRARLVRFVDPFGGELALLDQLGESPLVLDGQQVDLADLAQVHPHGVGGAAVTLRTRPCGCVEPDAG